MVLGVIVVALASLLLARARLSRRAPAGGTKLDSARGTSRWRLAGLLVGLFAASLVTRVQDLGVSTLLAAPMVSAGILIGVLVGELATDPGRSPIRQARVEVRRVRDFLPRRMFWLVSAVTVALALVLAAATTFGVPDDLGRAGRAVRFACSDGTTSVHGPWPGFYYSLPAAIAVLLGLMLSALALRRIVGRGRASTDSVFRARDDAVRRQTALAVTAAFGILASTLLAGTAFVAGTDLVQPCAPTAVLIAGWLGLVTSVASLGVLVLCVATVLFQSPVRHHPSAADG